MSDDDAPSRPVTSRSLRAEQLRVRLARAAGARSTGVDPGLSPQVEPRDPELHNRAAVVGFAFGICAVFLDPYVVPSVVAVVCCALGIRRARALRATGRAPWGRRRALWGLGLAAFGALGVLFHAVVPGLLR